MKRNSKFVPITIRVECEKKIAIHEVKPEQFILNLNGGIPEITQQDVNPKYGRCQNCKERGRRSLILTGLVSFVLIAILAMQLYLYDKTIDVVETIIGNSPQVSGQVSRINNFPRLSDPKFSDLERNRETGEISANLRSQYPEGTPSDVRGTDYDNNSTNSKFDATTDQIATSILNGRITAAEVENLLSALNELSSATGTEERQKIMEGMSRTTLSQLIQFGLLDSPSKEIVSMVDKSNKVIRLPDSVLDQYRSDYGISAIPEVNSWVESGEMINLPFPGGGNVDSIKAYEEFGLYF